jgi:hypothetical protein
MSTETEQPPFTSIVAPELFDDPYPAYAWLRRNHPVHVDPMGVYLLSTYEGVYRFFSNPEDFAINFELLQILRFGEEALEEPWYKTFRRMVALVDGSEHRRLRKMFALTFVPKRVAALEPRIQQITAELLAQVRDAGRMELVSDLGIPLPVHVMGELLGIPTSDQDRCGELARNAAHVIRFVPLDDDEIAGVNEATAQLAQYLHGLAEEVRAAGPEDSIRSGLFAAMVLACDAEPELDEHDAIANTLILYAAGHDTTMHGLGLAMLSLFRQPDQLEILRAEPDLLDTTAVEELLRYDTSGQALARVTVRDVEIAGTTIPAGSPVLGLMGSANRDETWCPGADSLDVRRRLDTPVTFGHGPHVCVGRALSKSVFAIAIKNLLALPGLAPVTLDPPMVQSPIHRGVEAFELTWQV